MQKVTVTVDGVEKKLVPIPYCKFGDMTTANKKLYYKFGDMTTANKKLYYKFADMIAANEQLYSIADKKDYLCLDYNGNKIFRGDRIIAVGKVTFNKWVIIIDHIETAYIQLFTTEQAADEFIKANTPFTLTTHDGVEVKEGDNVVIVNVEMRKVQSIANKNLIRISSAIFSTDIAADNYIRENKVCLSLAMVIDELKGGGYTSVGLPRNRLSVLVDSIIKAESKLKTQVMKIS